MSQEDAKYYSDVLDRAGWKGAMYFEHEPGRYSVRAFLADGTSVTTPVVGGVYEMLDGFMGGGLVRTMEDAMEGVR